MLHHLALVTGQRVRFQGPTDAEWRHRLTSASAGGSLKTRRRSGSGAGLSGARLAGMLGWQQSKVSKIETRKQLPSEDDP